jgi:long-chain acyl-CoA synthetase
MLISFFKKVVEKYPENIAITYEQHHISYARLDEITNKLANGLIDLGIKKGDRAVILMPNIPHFIFCYYAALKVGAIIIPVNYLYPQEQIFKIIEDTKANVVFIWEGFGSLLKNLKVAHLIVLGSRHAPNHVNLTDLITKSVATNPSVQIYPDDSALIQFSTDNTDEPKGIELSHSNILSSVLSFVNSFAHDNSDVFGGLAPMFLLPIQVGIMNAALVLGAKLVFYSKLKTEVIKQALYEDRISFLLAPPSLFKMLLNEATEDQLSHSLRCAIAFGTCCNEELHVNFKDRFGIPIFDSYGLLEASSIIAARRMNSEVKFGSVGTPLENVHIKIVNDQGDEMSPGDIGEITISSRGIMKGYWNRPEKTSTAIRDGWLYTGDMGYMDQDGNLSFMDRREDIIYKGGFSIYPSEIEYILKKHPQVEDVAVIATPHPIHKQEVKACIVLKKDQQLSSEDIIDFCKKYVPVYKCPQVIQFHNSLPKNSMGKILKKKLREPV